MTSLWKVDDLATAVLMKRSIDIKGRIFEGEALRRQGSGEDAVNAHPSAGGFRLTGISNRERKNS